MYLGKIVLTALTAAAFSGEVIEPPVVTIDTLLASGAVVQRGVAPRYAPGVMEVVARNRKLPTRVCMVSSPVYPVGTWVWVHGVNTGALEHCFVMDESDPTVKCNKGRCESDEARHIRLKRWAELSYEVALRMCSRKHINHRPEQCPILVIYGGP